MACPERGSSVRRNDVSCIAEDCDRRAKARSMCKMHYSRWRKHGHTRGRPTVLERLISQIEVDGDCWIYTGYTPPDGYGRIHYNRKPALAHRVCYEQLVGPIPEGLELDHVCRRPACVNPDHLDPVDHRTNAMRGAAPAIRRHRRRECIHGHRMTAENTYVTPQGYRQCRTCRSARQKAAQL